MRTPFRAGITVLAAACGSLAAVVSPAHAADPVVWYVKQLSTTCSDDGPGTPEQPFCTIGRAAAVVAEGQTVEVDSGNYRERVAITASGTTFRAAPSAGVTLIGDTAGFVIDGQRDVTLRGLRAIGAAGSTLPALDIRDAAAITVEGGRFGMSDIRTSIPAVRLTGVSGALLRPTNVGGEVTVDATSSAVTITSTVGGTSPDPGFPVVGIRIGGRGHRIINSRIAGYSGAAIAVEPDAADTVVANNEIFAGRGVGIHNRGGSGTAIANNTVRGRCGDGIRVDGASAGVSVQNNVLDTNGGSGPVGCGKAGVEIGIHEGAVGHTVVDYNIVDHYDANSASLYGWNGAPMTLAAFQSASGQARHDLETGALTAWIDSANSAAPGYQPTDRLGQARADDLGIADTGAGPVRYADRGVSETYSAPRAASTFFLDLVTGTVTVDASASVPAVAPIASYTFHFGDGTVVTQTSPVATHRYGNPGEYNISISVTGTDTREGFTNESVSVLRSTATMGLLSLFNQRYVALVVAERVALAPSEATLTHQRQDPVRVPLRRAALAPSQVALTVGGQFDLADAGSGQVALMLRSTGKYLSVDIQGGRGALTWTKTKVEDTERWYLVRNLDGSVSFRSVATEGYISLESQTTPHLIVNSSAVSGPWEKFHQVHVADTDRTLKAHANNKLVVAENGGAKPLIANGTAIGVWDRFDFVDLGNGQVALFARANNRFVVADSAGTKPLIANRVAVGEWERFILTRNSDGTVSLRAAVNNRWVVADNAGANPLIANRQAIGVWERFTLG